jgi:hypothetical protein
VTRARTELTAYAGILGSLLAPTLVLAAPWQWLTLTGALVLACIPAGAAVMCWIDSGEDSAQAALTLALSLTAIALASALMIWTSTWQPHVLLVFALAGTVSCGARLWPRASR